MRDANVLGLILLFPFGLTGDQIVWWSFIATGVAAVCAIWSGIASTAAAKYGKDAPTKADFKRLEDHAAATSQHLDRQARREALNTKANRTHICISGLKSKDEDLDISVMVLNPIAGLRLTRIDLINKAGNLFESTVVTQRNDSTYVTRFSPTSVLQCFLSENVGNVSSVRIRVHMVIEEEEVCREVPVRLSQCSIRGNEPQSHLNIPAWKIEGEV